MPLFTLPPATPTYLALPPDKTQASPPALHVLHLRGEICLGMHHHAAGIMCAEDVFGDETTQVEEEKKKIPNHMDSMVPIQFKVGQIIFFIWLLTVSLFLSLPTN
jgi:hypothetical protein